MHTATQHILPELLAPCGSPQALRSAVKAGADAVYFGGSSFNARLNAHNFDEKELRDAVDFCHSRGVKAYVTFNTLVYDRELPDALRYAEQLYLAGVDALILADVGLSRLIHRFFPDFELHASTQLSGHNIAAAEALAGEGFSRMVCARELSRENITALVKQSPIEIEMFIHGAMCVCHSGQCLMSSVIGGRSGNRGLCAQPCRMKYDGGYPISLKDMSLATHVRELIDMGVSSLKIEGRMKSPDYVYGVVSTYRALLDEGRDAEEEEMKHLASLFSRGGFSDGYFTGAVGPAMLGIRSDEDKQATKAVSGKRALSAAAPKKAPTKVQARRYRLGDTGSLRSLLSKKVKQVRKMRTARFYDPAAITDQAVDYFRIRYLPLDRLPLDTAGRANGVMLPPVIPDSESTAVFAAARAAYDRGIRHFLVGNLGHIAPLKALFDGEELRQILFHGDWRLNVCNSFTADRFSEALCDVMLSPELTLPQIRDIAAEKAVIVYGRLPLMLCEKPIGSPLLTDRTGAKFPVIAEGGRDEIFNSVPVYMADKNAVLQDAGVGNRHFIFTTENPRQVDAVIDAYRNATPPKDQNVRRIK